MSISFFVLVCSSFGCYRGVRVSVLNGDYVKSFWLKTETDFVSDVLSRIEIKITENDFFAVNKKVDF